MHSREPVASPRALMLASRSPQRSAILEQLGIEFSVLVPDVEELEVGPPGEIAVENAYRKARAVADRCASGARGPAVVLAVDTVVCIGARLYGKPADEAAARATIAALSGRRHAVIGGLCLIEDDNVRTAAATTIVEFRTLDDELIDWYVRSGEWSGRAGGYAIQGRGAALIARIDGDYLNVVGLPVATLLALAPELLGAD